MEFLTKLGSEHPRSTSFTTTFDWPATSDLYSAGEVSFLSALQIPLEKDFCCRDWGAQSRDFIENGTNNTDNSLAALGIIMYPFGFDLQATVDGVLQSGDFVPLLDFYDYAGPDGEVHLAFHRGNFQGATDWASASGGAGFYTISDANFVSGTGTPKARFNSAVLTAGELDASGGLIEIAMPLAPGANLVLPLRDVNMTATTSEGPTGGLNISGGELSGHVLLDEFYEAYNLAADALCGTCANLQGDIFTQDAYGEWQATGCGDASGCTLPEESGCADLVDGFICPAIPGLMDMTAADLDLDGDGTYEAMSAGLRISGVPGEIVAVQ